MSKKSYTIAELSSLFNASFSGNGSHPISGVNTLDDATLADASFLANPKYNEAMKKSNAGVICIATGVPVIEEKNYLISANPSLTFQSIAALLLPQSQSAFSGIHPTAVIHPSAKIAAGVTVGPFAVIDQNVVIGANTFIGPHVCIGFEVNIGNDCYIHPHCTVREKCQLGNRVILQPGAVVGSCGFGYVTDAQGVHKKLEQLGVVVIEDDVEIGANTTIDRSRFKETIIRKGTKIDNLVQIAHNVEVGDGNLIAAQTGIAGSSKTGKYVMLGGQVGIVGHVELDDFVMVATRGGVSKSLKKGKYRGSPAMPINEYHRQEVHVRKLEEYVERLKVLEKEIALLKGDD